MIESKVRFLVKRQLTPEAKPYWEEFDLQYQPGMNVISGLMDIATTPIDRFGKKTTPIAYEANCLEEVCGSCAMRINGCADMACSALVDKLQHPVRLEPLSRFPVVCDLSVDRSVLFENLKRLKAWVRFDGTYDLGSGPRVEPGIQEKLYPLSRCISCCLCLEVCPQATEDIGFVGAAVINQVRLFNESPSGKVLKSERLHAMMGDGGIHECAYAQNCVPDLSQGHPTDNVNFHRVWPSDEAGAERFLSRSRNSPGRRTGPQAGGAIAVVCDRQSGDSTGEQMAENKDSHSDEFRASLTRLPQLADPVIRLNLEEELKQLHHAEAWTEASGRSAKTLAKYADFRVVLISMKGGGHMKQHHADGRISIQCLRGRLGIHLPGQPKIEMTPGGLLILDCGIPHDVDAIEESALLVTISWHGPQDHASGNENLGSDAGD